MLTETRGLSIGEASPVLTASALAWAAGSWWQSRVIVRSGARRITALGAMLIATGAAVVAVGLLEVPVIVPYVGWAIGSVGMGIVFPTIPLAVMAAVDPKEVIPRTERTSAATAVGSPAPPPGAGRATALAGLRNPRSSRRKAHPVADPLSERDARRPLMPSSGSAVASHHSPY